LQCYNRLCAKPLADNPFVFEVNVPAFGLTGCVLEGEGEDTFALFDGGSTLGFGGGDEGVDSVKGGGGGEGVCGGGVSGCVSGIRAARRRPYERPVTGQQNLVVGALEAIGTYSS